jgi:fructose PTS system EIIB component
VKILCVTSCFTGIVHTYLAAEALHLAGEHLGHDILVETQGPAGSAPFTEADIAEADGILFAVELEVFGRERFVGKPYLETELLDAINTPAEVIGRLASLITEGTASTVTGVLDAPADGRNGAPDSTPQRGFLAKLFGRGRRD